MRFFTVHVPSSKSKAVMKFVHWHIFESVSECDVNLQTAANWAVCEAQTDRMRTSVTKLTHRKWKDNHSSENMNSEAVSSQKMKILLLCEQFISFTAENLTVSLILSYMNNVPQLFIEWKNFSFVLLKEIAVPLCHWAKLYHLNQPELWDILKKQYSEWKVHKLWNIRLHLSFLIKNLIADDFSQIIMKKYESYCTAENFWIQYTVTDLKTKSSCSASYSELLKLIHQKRKDVDAADAEKVKLEYTDNVWAVNFSYVKSDWSAVIKWSADIACLYWRLQQQLQS